MTKLTVLKDYLRRPQTSLMEAILAAPAKMGEDDGDGDRLAAIAAIERVERASGNRTMIDGGHCGRAGEREGRGEQWKSEGANNGCSLWSSLGCSGIYEVQYMKICGALGNTGLPFEVLSWPPHLFIDIIYGNLLNNMWF